MFDAHKALVATEEAKASYVTLKKGEHSLRLVVRHDSQELLDKLKALPLVRCALPLPCKHEPACVRACMMLTGINEQA